MESRYYESYMTYQVAPLVPTKAGADTHPFARRLLVFNPSRKPPSAPASPAALPSGGRAGRASCDAAAIVHGRWPERYPAPTGSVEVP